MPEVTEGAILAALDAVRDPDRGASIVALDMVRGLVIRNGNVGFSIEVDPERGAALEPLRNAAEQAVRAVPGVVSATVVLTAHRDTPSAPQAGRTPPGRNALELPGIGAIVAVASGKGGVGKSTTAVNLALAFAGEGLRVGMLDADIYGPSLPTMLGIKGRPDSPDGKTIIPMQRHGLVCMSIGFMVAEDTPMIWRGPMVMGALEQMLKDVQWGELDVLVVDMPPGTGDAQLTMAQRVPMAGAVIVSTPQDLALLDARRGLNMFRKVEVPVLGFVENMSYFVCPHCGERSDIFTHGGAHRAADELGVDFLGEIPLDMEIRETSDGGSPIVVAKPESPHSEAYRAIARKIWAKLEGATAEGPGIVIQ